ncbi:hypothetical protein [Arcobacter sp. F2176]|nr:hypothetical protein [Arcobacter sp. F2176]
MTLDNFSISKYEITYKEFDLYSEIVGKDLIRKKHIGKPFRDENNPVMAP